MATLLVIAAPGLKVPKEEKPRDYITDTPPEGDAGYVVEDSAWTLRRIADGDLVVVEPAATVKSTAKTAKE
jgi:hypothetical protein